MIGKAKLRPNKAETVGIADIAVHLPGKMETSAQLAAKAGLSKRVLEKKYGILTKRVADANEHASDLAARAAEKIIRKTAPLDVDVLIYCGSPYKDYQVWPCAAKIQHELGLKNAFAFEITNMSAGFSTALKVARDMMLADPELTTILLVGGCKESAIIDPANPRTRFMLNFADCGAAILLQRGCLENVVLDSFFYTDGSYSHHVKVPAGGSVLPASRQTVDGKKHLVEVFEPEVMKKRLNRSSGDNFIMVIREALARSGFTGIKPDFLALLHMKPSVFQHILNELGMTGEQSFYLSDFGHMSSLDIVVALHQGLMRGQIRPGHLVVAASAGTGYTWGATVIKWLGGKQDRGAPKVN